MFLLSFGFLCASEIEDKKIDAQVFEQEQDLYRIFVAIDHIGEIIDQMRKDILKINKEIDLLKKNLTD